MQSRLCLAPWLRLSGAVVPLTFLSPTDMIEEHSGAQRKDRLQIRNGREVDGAQIIAPRLKVVLPFLPFSIDSPNRDGFGVCMISGRGWA